MPKFETWDVEDVPSFVTDYARAQGAEQAALVASSVGDTLARDAGWNMGEIMGGLAGLCIAACGKTPSPSSAVTNIAGGYLKDEEELLALRRYDQEDE